MSIKLTWDDILDQHMAGDLAARCLGPWSATIGGRVAPIAMSKFGDWILRREDGSTYELSVLEGTFEKIADSPEEFRRQVNQREWQEKHLLSLIVYSLHERGIIPREGQCYAFAPHPILVGRIVPETAMIMDIVVWQHICAQVFLGQSAV